jgi:hypothetical protein
MSDQSLGDIDAFFASRKAPPAQPVSEIDAYFDAKKKEEGRLRASLDAALQTTPEKAAKVKYLSHVTGLPPAVVETNEGEAEARAKLKELSTLAQHSPVLRARLQDPNFSPLAVDDAQNLSNIEQGLKTLGGVAGNVLGGATVEVGATIFGGQAVITDLISGIASSVGADTVANAFGRIATASRNQASRARGSLDDVLPKPTGNLTAGLYSGARSAGFNLATLPAAVQAATTQGSMAAANVMGLIAAGATAERSYNKGREAGLGQVGSLTYAAPDAMAEYLFERWSGGQLFTDIAAKSTALKMLMNYGGREVIGENATTLAQDFNEWVRLNPQKTVGEFIAERPDAIIQTTVAALTGAGITTGAIKTLEKISSIDVKDQTALQELEEMKKVLAIAAGSKLRERDPESFKQFVQMAADESGGAPSSVFVDGKMLLQTLQQAGVTEEQLQQAMPSVMPQLADAATANSPVEIPIGELTTALPGTPLEQALLPHLRTTADGVSQFEAEQSQKEAQQLLQQEADRVIKQAADSVTMAAESEMVYTQMFDQLMATNRMSRDVAEKNAMLVREFFTIMAPRAGKSVAQMWAESPYAVRAQGTQTDVLNKEDLNSRLQARIDGDFAGAVREYSALEDTNGGQILNTDAARELSLEYQADRTRAAEVHEASSAFINRLYAEKLSKPAAKGVNPRVLFTAGGTGAGKSTGLALMPGLADSAEIVYDGTMSKLKSAVTRIDQALAAGRDVDYMYVYRDPAEALVNGALPRAMRSGRTAPLSVLYESHTGARQVVETLVAKYANDPRVRFTFVDNSRGKDAAAVVALAEIPQIDDNGLKERLNEILDQELAAGRISESVYRGTFAAGEILGGSRPDAGSVQGPAGSGRPEAGGSLRAGSEQGLSGELNQSAPKSDIGHKREKASGRYVGAPDWVGGSPQQLAKLRKKLRQLALEGESGRYWYERSSKAVLDLVGGDKADAEKFVGLLAIYSQGTEVNINLGFALEAYYQWKAGLPISTGRFPTEQTKKADAWLKEGKDWGGIKTNNFYADLMEEIDPSKFDEGHATMDMWMALAFDYGAKVLDQGPKYGFAKRETARLAQELGWKPHQVQAAIWTSIKARVETTAKERNTRELAEGIAVKNGNAHAIVKGREYDHFRMAHAVAMESKITKEEIAARGVDFADALESRAVQMSWEATPSVTGGDLPGIHTAPTAQKMEYLAAIAGAITPNGRDLVAELINLHTPPTVFGFSAWEGAVGAGAQSFFPVPIVGQGKDRAVLQVARDMLGLYSAIKGYVLKQDAVVWHTPVWDDSKARHNGAHISTSRPLSEAEVQQLYVALNQRFGTWDLAPGWRPDGVRVLNFVDGLDNKEFQKGIDEVIESLPEGFGGQIVSHAGFRSDGDYIGNNWKDSPNGEEYTNRIAAQRPDILGGVAALRARVEAVNADFIRRYGWDKPAGFVEPDGAFFQSPNPGVRAGTAQDEAGPRPGSVDLTGIHFSQQTRVSLDGRYYGHGLKGIERERIYNSPDQRLRERVYFYIDEGKGVRPEAGVGGAAHSVELTNLYDINSDPLKLIAGGDLNATESNILNAGFNGYYRRDAFNQQGAAVVIGPASRGMMATAIPNPTTKAPPMPVAPQVYKRGLLSRELNTLDIGAVQQVAPSARVSSGVFQVAEAELGAARQALAGQGIDLPELALNQEARGSYRPATLTTVLNEGADMSTFLHETGHFFLDMLMRLASEPGATAEIQDMAARALKDFGVKDLATWNGMTLDQQRAHHERFAETFELYLFNGKAPNKEIAPLFRTFRAWLTRVYKSMQQFAAGKGISLDSDLVKVMDKMLATDEQIAEAEEIAGLIPEMDATSEAQERLQARSLRDLKWSVNARNKKIKELQAEAREKRKEVEKEVTAEVEAMPEFSAKTALDAIRKETRAAPTEAAMMAVADAKGFASTEAMLEAIEAVGKKADVIEGMTDQRMLERYGDLTDQRAIEEAATEAVHNEARAKSLATELAAQREMLNPRTDTGRTNAAGNRVTVNALVDAAKQFAANVIGRSKIADMKKKAWAHVQAERRAGKAWEAATAKGDTQAAVQAKQDQMLNNAAVRAAHEAQAQIRKSMDLFSRVTRGNDEKLVERGYDPDVANAARAILAAYGIAPAKGKSAMEYLEAVQKNDPQMYSVINQSVTAALVNAKPLDQLTVEELQALTDEIASLWHLAKRSRQMEIDGNLMDRAEVEEDLKERMLAIGIPTTMPGDSSAITPGEKAMRALSTFRAAARRIESWVHSMDGSVTGGSFTRYVFQPVKEAADNYRADKAKYIKAYRALLDKISPDLKKGEIAAPELGYTFGKDTGGVGMSELLHAVLHTGNESNKRKLLLGRGWATENPDGTLDTGKWDSFMERATRTGLLNKAHFDFAQGVWDLLESTKPMAQKTHRDVFGRYFNEVTATPFEIPGIGYYRGGYVPAMADSRIVADAATRTLAEEENQTLAYAFPATNRGFTKGRVDYNRPLLLDLRSLAQHMDKVLLFSHLESPVRDVRKVLTAKGVAYGLNRIDPAAFDNIVTPWLNRAARQQVETPTPGDAGLMRVFTVARSRAGMAAMFANVANSAQQLTGFSMAALKVKPTYMISAAAEMVSDRKGLLQKVGDASVYMKERMENDVANADTALREILLDPNLYEKSKAWTAKHAYFMQQAVDNAMSPVIWTAAFNQAVAQGQSDKDAVRFADSVVRTTQGSNLPEDVSRIEGGNAFVRMFTQFMGYFNMQANLLGTEFNNIARDVGVRKGAGKMLYATLLGFLAPAWVAEAIMQAFRGGPDDEDKDGEYLDDWIAAVLGWSTLRNATAMVPVVGQITNAAVNATNSKPYDDRIGSNPAISMIESSVRAPISVYKAIVEDGNQQKAVRDVATLISMSTGLPANAVAKPIGYAAGVEQGKINPSSAADAARGAITGVASPGTK